MITWLRLQYYTWKHRNINAHLCCCGSFLYTCRDGQCASRKQAEINKSMGVK